MAVSFVSADERAYARSAATDAGGGVVGAGDETIAAGRLDDADAAVGFGDDLAQGGRGRFGDALPFRCGRVVRHVAGRRDQVGHAAAPEVEPLAPDDPPTGSRAAGSSAFPVASSAFSNAGSIRVDAIVGGADYARTAGRSLKQIDMHRHVPAMTRSS